MATVHFKMRALLELVITKKKIIAVTLTMLKAVTDNILHESSRTTDAQARMHDFLHYVFVRSVEAQLAFSQSN